MSFVSFLKEILLKEVFIPGYHIWYLPSFFGAWVHIIGRAEVLNFFVGHSLLQFVRRCADHFLTSEQQEVRLEAVRTCSRLLRLALHGTTSRHSETVTTTVADVLGKLLVVGITDTGENFGFLYATAALLNSFSQLISEHLIHITS